MKVDFSIIPTYECNLTCWFCMYDASPDNKNKLDYNLTKNFVKTIDWSIINSIGLYGGEISINLLLYQKFIDLIPKNISLFTITNGSWSSDEKKLNQFIDFVFKNKLRTKISNTPEHRKHQNISVLKLIEKETNGDIYVKKNDDTEQKLLSMGRLASLPVTCSMKCKKSNLPYRLALEPNGNIIFQLCDGRYPTIGSYYDSFTEIINKLNNFQCDNNESQQRNDKLRYQGSEI